MQNQRDRVAAHNTLVGRMSAGLLLGRTTYEDAPARRAWFGTLCGILVGVLMAVGFGVYGLIKPLPSTEWRTAAAVVVEEETGTRLLWEDGKLVPALNYTSALLRAGPDAHVEAVERELLVGVPLGAPIGIPGAPDAVPAPNDLVGGGWLLCLPRSGADATAATSDLGMRVAPDLDDTPLPADRYAWVQGPDGAQYVLTADAKYALPDPTAAVALGLVPGVPMPAPQVVLDALPERTAVVAAPRPEGPPVVVGGLERALGDHFAHRRANGSVQLLVLLGDGLAPTTATEVALAQATGAAPPTSMDSGAMASAPVSTDMSRRVRLPELTAMTVLDTEGDELCLNQDTRGLEVVSTLVTAPAGGGGTGMIPGEGIEVRTGMNAVPGASVSPLSGLYAASLPLPTELGEDPDRYLITDTGLKYQLEDDDAITSLGLGGIDPRPVDAEVLAAIPSGPILGRAAVGVPKGDS